MPIINYSRWLIWMTTTSASRAYETIPFFALLFGSRRELEGLKKDVLGCPNKHRVIFLQKKTRMRHCPRLFFWSYDNSFATVSSNVILFLHQNSSKFLLLDQILHTWAYLFDFIFQVKGPCLSLRRHKEKLQTLLVPPFRVLFQPGFIVIIYTNPNNALLDY